MNTRLLQFLTAENISQAQFADKIDVARASVSHIISGRNKPGYDFLASMMKYFPNLNIEWLISGKGKMYKNSGPELFNVKDDTRFPNELPFDRPFDSPSTFLEEPVSVQDVTPLRNIEISETSHEVKREEILPQMPEKQRKAVKIMIFYDDNTFQEFQK